MFKSSELSGFVRPCKHVDIVTELDQRARLVPGIGSNPAVFRLGRVFERKEEQFSSERLKHPSDRGID